MDALEEKIKYMKLYDFYGEILKSPKKEMFEDYVLNDYSLSEIADNNGITRQGVHEVIKRCEKKLADMEEALKLCERYENALKKCDEILSISQSLNTKEGKRITALVEEIKNNGI